MSINSALSGLVAAQTSIGASANNTANARSTYGEENGIPVNKPYEAVRVENTSLATGGVLPVVLPVEPSSLPIYDPSSRIADERGIVRYPNVQEDSEAVSRIMASRAYEANLKVIETYQELDRMLTDII